MTAIPDTCRGHRHHEFASIRTGLSADILRYLNKSPENQAAGNTFKSRLGAFLTPNLQALLLYRIAHYLHVIEWRRLARFITRVNSLVHKVSISPDSCIGPGCFLPHPTGLTFHGTAGCHLTLYSLAICCPHASSPDSPPQVGPHLGDRVTVGGHAVLWGPITVGDDTKVAFSVNLERDAPDGVLVVSKAQRVSMQPRLDL